MPKGKTLQSSFNSGVFSPELASRIDIDKYYKAASKIDNGIVMPQGGVTKRTGFKRLDDLTVLENGNDFRLFPFEFSDTESYMVVLTMDGTFHIYEPSGNMSGTVVSKTFALGSDIMRAQFTQSGDTMILVHPLYQPHRLYRDRTKQLEWKIEPIKMKFIPNYAFGNSYLSSVWTKQQMTFQGFVNGDSMTIQQGINDVTLTLPYEVEEVIFDVTTAKNGDWFGDDASKMVTKLNNAFSGDTFYDNYRTEEVTEYRENPDGSFTEITLTRRFFTHISLNVPTGRRYWCKSKSNVKSALLVLPKGDNITVDLDVTPSSKVLEQRLNFNGFTNNTDMTLTWGTGSQILTTYTVTKIPMPLTTEDINNHGINWGDNVDVMAEALKGLFDGASVTPIYTTEEVYASIVAGNTTFRQKTLKLTFTGFTVGADSTGVSQKITLISGTGSITTEVTQVENPDDASDKKEPVWSDNRGYPATVTIHNNRLVFGGSLSRPQTIWMSKIGNYFDFSTEVDVDPDATILATDALDITLSTSEFNPITGLLSSRDLVVTTSGSVHTISGESGVITPQSVYSKTVDRLGAKLVQPVEVDGKILFLQSYANSLSSTVFDFASDNYQVTSESLFSNHILNEPKQMTKITSIANTNTTYVAVLNEDGSIGYFCAVEAQGISNWTRITTEGYPIDIAAINDKLYAIIKRNTKVSLEVISTDSPYVDGAIELKRGYPSDVIGGLKHWANESVAVLADGYDLVQQVNAEGIVKLPFKASEIIVGKPIDFIIETMPINVNVGSGPTVNSSIRVISGKVNILDSRGVVLSYEGKAYRIEDLKMGFKLKQAPPLITGVFTKTFLGWSKQAIVGISSQVPVATTIRSIELEVYTRG